MENRFNYKISKLGLSIGIISLLIGMSFGTWWLLQPTWQPILSSIDEPHSRLEIRNKLMEWGVPYKEDLETNNILVQESQLLSLRAKLGEAGIPEERSPGLEIFSDAEYGMSEFTQRINYQRAIESEIANTIRSFTDVNAAKVHLTIPKQSLFKNEKAIPKASVTIKPRPEQELSPHQISGIAQLVAAAVEGLTAENVIVLNDKGEVISSGPNDLQSESKQSLSDMEQYYAQKARELVIGIAQTDNVKISVNITYNFNKVKSVREEILPKSNSEYGHLHKVKRQVIKSNEGDGELPSSNTQTEEEFLFSKERSEIEYSQGDIELLSIGIVVTKELSNAVVENIKTVVSSGLGFNAKRGDQIAVVAIPENPQEHNKSIPSSTISSVIPDTPDSSDVKDLWSKVSIVQKIGAGVIAVVILLIIVFIAIRRAGETQLLVPQLPKSDQEALLVEVRQWLTKDQAGNSR